MSLVFVRSDGTVVHMDYFVGIRQRYDDEPIIYETVLASAHASFVMTLQELDDPLTLDVHRKRKQVAVESVIARALREEDPEVHAEAVRLGWLTATRIN